MIWENEKRRILMKSTYDLIVAGGGLTGVAAAVSAVWAASPRI